jgi:transcriptional regulator GlxA family with amidase domain
MPPKALPRIAILAQPSTSASVVFGMYDLFCSAGRDWSLVTTGTVGASLLETEIVAVSAEAFEVANGVLLRPHRSFEDSPTYDIVCVPELTVTPHEPLQGRFEAEVAWLTSQHARGALLATACSGSVLLAEAGLLAGNDATTHWAFCDALQENYPNVRVHRDRALVVTGEGQRLVMAGGGVSWLDLALYLIARVTTLEAAMQVARMNLIDWHQSGQVPYARLARTRQVDDVVIAKCQAWIAERPNVEAPVASMVRLSGLAERTFKRRFRQATGMAPLEYVHTLRLDEAKRQLEISDDPIEVVAERAGYEDAAFFSRLFKRSVKLTPAQYRRRFGALRDALKVARRPPAS